LIRSNLIVGILIPFKRKKSSPAGKKLYRLQVSLDNLEVKMALQLGDGDLCLGIRRALVLGSLRQFETLTSESFTSPDEKLPPLG